ncbi:S8 family peptidase [Lysobacter terrae]
MIRMLLMLLLAVCGMGVAQAADADEDAQQGVQVLLMLRTPTPHYRPDTYGGAYQAPGRTARRALARRLAHAQGLALREDWAMPLLGLDCFVLDAADQASAARAMVALARDPRVESTQPLQRFRTLATAAPRARGDPFYRAQPAATRWHLAQLHLRTTGAGVNVAVVDTAVAAHHPDLLGQVAVQRDFVVGDGVVAREHKTAERHGTEVAGVIAARADNGLGIVGIAPQARLLALRACWELSADLSECNSFTLAKALQFAIEHHADVINLSLAGAPDPLLSRLLDAALRRGIVVVAAFDPGLPRGGFPASHPGVLAATDVRGAHPTDAYWIPAAGTPAPVPDGGWALVDGSSIAAAQLSGLAALARQRAPRMSAVQLRAWMPQRSAVDACLVIGQAEDACVCNCTIASATMVTPRP